MFPKNSGFSPQIIHFFIRCSVIFTIHFGGKHPYIFGNIPKWSCLVGKPHGFVGETHHFRKTPYTSQVILTDSPLCVDRPRYSAIPHGHPHRHLGSQCGSGMFLVRHIYASTLWVFPRKKPGRFFCCWENLTSSLKSRLVSLYSGYYIYIYKV